MHVSFHQMDSEETSAQEIVTLGLYVGESEVPKEAI